MKLRLYQFEHIKRIVRELKERNIAGLFSAVGSGKTTESKIVINEVLKEEVLGIKKVIIASPFLTIAKDFETSENDEIYTCPTNPLYNASSFVIPGNSIKLIDDDTTREMRRVLKAKDYDPRSFSHASLARIGSLVEDPSAIFQNTLLVIDEAHHCFHDEEEDSDQGTLLGQVVNKAIERGAKVLYLTATPYRTEGSKTTPIVDITRCNPVIRTIGEQILDGYSPMVEVEYVHIKGDTNFLENRYKHDSAIVDGPNVIFSKPKQARIYAEHIYEQWIKDGCPKAIIVIPGGESITAAESIKTFFMEKGFPEKIEKIRKRKTPVILDAVGCSSKDRERILSEIRADKIQNGHKYDLVIGCRRFDEGTDVPSASHVYMTGIPGNVRLFHQRVGRILRDKNSVNGYSKWFGKAWLGKAKAVFFVPLFTKVDELDGQVARQLLHCIFAGESYQAYCESVSSSIELKKAVDHLKDPVDDHSEDIEELIKTLDAFKMMGDIDHSQRMTELAIEIKKNPDITIKEFCERVLDGVEDPTEKMAIQTAIVENLSCVTVEDIKKLAGDVIGKISHAVPKKDPGMILRPCDSAFEKEMGIAFKYLINKFGKEKVEFKTDRYVDRVLTTLTGEDLKYWTECCEFLYDNEEQSNKMCRALCEWIKAHN